MNICLLLSQTTVVHFMSEQLNLGHRSFACSAVLFYRELGAYEALWARPNATFKSLADLFRKHPGAAPSEFVKPRVVTEYALKALHILKHTNVTNFGIRVEGVNIL